MKSTFRATLILIVFFFFNLYPQYIHKIMTYNLLNYPGNDSNIRNPHFNVVISNSNPDILIVQEMISQTGVNLFLNTILKTIDTSYQAGEFIDGPDSDNAIFYKSTYFSFISNTRIPTSLRDINEFKLVHKSTNDTIRIFSVHLKASTGTTNEQQRLSEVNILRDFTFQLPPNTSYLLVGDFNIYRSTEPAYQRLLDQSTAGYFIDVIDMPGIWNNSIYSIYHTQSPRVRSFGGGAIGGLDDRFDMILFSPSIIQNGTISFVNNSYTVFGNDGLHYNDSINRMPNNAVPQVVADALHYASDHLPVYVLLNFEESLPVELVSFIATVKDDNVILNWKTASEKNNYGFAIERKSISSDNWTQVGFVIGNGNSNSPKEYSFIDKISSSGIFKFRLKQIDNDGSYKYSGTVEIELLKKDFKLFQNYPNPFNSTTNISWQNPIIFNSPETETFISIKLYDILGKEIDTIVEGYFKDGTNSVSYTINSSFPSGVYFYQFKSGNYIETKKMVYLR